VDFASSPFRVNTVLRPWDAGVAPRRAGVSAFGFGGTNVHVILEEAPSSLRPVRDRGTAGHVLRPSARRDGALESLSGRFADLLSGSGEAREDICRSASGGRATLPYRVVVRGASVDQVREGLTAVAGGSSHVASVRGHADVTTAAPIAFLFTGLGAQYVG